MIHCMAAVIHVPKGACVVSLIVYLAPSCVLVFCAIVGSALPWLLDTLILKNNMACLRLEIYKASLRVCALLRVERPPTNHRLPRLLFILYIL